MKRRSIEILAAMMFSIAGLAGIVVIVMALREELAVSLVFWLAGIQVWIIGRMAQGTAKWMKKNGVEEL